MGWRETVGFKRLVNPGGEVLQAEAGVDGQGQAVGRFVGQVIGHV